MSIRIQDRVTAGRDLARSLTQYRKQRDVIVLALPRGGVPVGAEIAHALHAPLDLIVVRKLGTPGHEELAMGAIASGGIRVLNRDVVSSLGITDDVIERVAAREGVELERRMKAYRGERAWQAIEGKRVILVDDGVATGATMRAAIAALRSQAPAKIIVAVPVAPFDTLVQLRREADEVICLASPEPFQAIGLWYGSFPQLSDEEVRCALFERWGEHDPGPVARKSRRTKAPDKRPAGENGTRILASRPTHEENVTICSGSLALEGTLRLPGPAHGLVVFAHGSGSSRFSTRNRHVAEYLNEVGLATLLFDLLAPGEQKLDERTGELRFDIGMNRQAAARLKCEHRLEIVPGASHLFEESGKLESVARLARGWFERCLRRGGVTAGAESSAAAPT